MATLTTFAENEHCMTYLYLKAVHIIFVVTWFAGLFYMVRLFIYTVEASQKPEPDKTILLDHLIKMQSRLWYFIAWPSALITLVAGGWLAVVTDHWLELWFQMKLLFVAGLFLYHLLCDKIFRQLRRKVYSYSSTQLRVWNEVATLFLFAIVFIVVLKSTMSLIWGMIGLVVIGALLMLGIKGYKRLKNE